MKPLKLELVNALQKAIENPKTFEVPTLTELRQLKPGDHVKICVEQDGKGGERFWCKIRSIDPKAKTIIGEVDNILVVYDFELGTPIEINFDEVYDLITKPY